MNFLNIYHTKKDEGHEKHIPTIKFIKNHGNEEINTIKIVVGNTIAHPNTLEHSIKWIDLYIQTNDKKIKFIGRQEFEPTICEPVAKFKISKDIVDCTEEIIAVSYCNLHGLWIDSVSISS